MVQCFTDMAGIERLAGALFAAQARKATDATLRAIFESFVIDEERHATVARAARAAPPYHVHHYPRTRCRRACWWCSARISCG